MGWGLGILVAALAVAAAVLYNLLVAARLRVREAWSSTQVQLERRASLIPNLVETVKGYAAFERATLERVTAARTALGAASGPRAAAQASDALTDAVGRILAIAEAYPDLKASEQFAKLQTDLSETENLVAYARNYYNGAVELYNNRVQQVPTLIVARLFGFAPAEFFTAEPGADEVPSVR